MKTTSHPHNCAPPRGGGLRIAVIGGSGFYAWDRLSGRRELSLKTPFGKHSGPILLGDLDGVRCAFLPRHGKGHVLLPTEVNSRANIYALKTLGVERIVGLGAVGSLKEEIAPRHFFFPDQIVDETKHRRATFFGGGVVAHAAFAQPFCPGQTDLLYEAAKSLGITAHRGGTYACMEGPLFSTLAESEFHRRMGYSVIGMTALPEAKLAREAEICYTSATMITDYDCWKPGEEVSTSKVVENLSANIANALRMLEAAIPRLAALPRDCACAKAMEGALFTDPNAMDKRTVQKLRFIIGKYVEGGDK
ncbi:MAG: S-methyl-5'-thioadenosine phosphorylase [Elusimicrobia bacterium]|nr:S-methyl-5'-thioadenosine phosphorylase [Elusimicrobiota bacterium]